MERRVLTYILAAIIGLMVTACSGGKPDARLLQAEAVMSDSLPLARAMLDSIDSSTLSESDRHLHALLTIKGRDKDFERHATDSTILRVVDYYEDHRSAGRYAEALYYAGRVYSDLGDYPTALRYFHDALDALPEDKLGYDEQMLQGNILSQIGRRLNTLRMYDEAAKYIDKVIDINFAYNDSVNLVYNLELLGAIKMHSKKYDEAEKIFRQSLSIAENLSNSLRARQMTYLAAIKLEKSEFDTALCMIRGIPEQITDSYKNTALGYAAIIYLRCDRPDSAYMYARQIIDNDSQNNLKTAYGVIFSPDILAWLPADTVTAYNIRYAKAVEEFVSRNAESASQIQISQYNYKLHERERRKVETKNGLLLKSLFVLVFLIISSSIYFRYRNKNHILQLRNALDMIAFLREQIEDKTLPATSSISLHDNHPSDSDVVPAFTIVDKDKLRQRLIDEISSLCDRRATPEMPSGVLESDAYGGLERHLISEQCIPEASVLWKDLERLIDSYWPKFNSNVSLLLKGRMTEHEYRLVILIKLGMSPRQLCVLTGREKGTISKRRGILCQKMLGVKGPTMYIDRFIRLL